MTTIESLGLGTSAAGFASRFPSSSGDDLWQTSERTSGELPGRSDERLVRAMATADRDALAELYDRLAPALLAVARHGAGPREAEELLHDVFVEAWRRSGEYDATRSAVRSWLLALLRSRVGSASAIALEPVQPASELRGRLLETISGAERYAPFTARFAAIFDLDETTAAGLLRSAASGLAYGPGPVPGSELSLFTPGPRESRYEAGFVRAASGVVVPEHQHEGQEVSLVLAGICRDLAARRDLHPGETLELEAGTSHALTAAGPEELVLALLLRGPITFERS